MGHRRCRSPLALPSWITCWRVEWRQDRSPRPGLATAPMDGWTLDLFGPWNKGWELEMKDVSDVSLLKQALLHSGLKNLKKQRCNMELDPWQPQLQEVFGEFRCGKTQLCLSLGLVTLDRLDQQGVVSAQSCEQVIFLMKRTEGEILHQCGKWWYDILLRDICQSSCCNIHFGLIAWAFLRPYLVCCLPAAYQQGRWWKQGTESKFPEVSLPEIAFWRLHYIFRYFHFFQLNMYNLILIYSFRCHDMILLSLLAASQNPAKMWCWDMLKYVDGFLLSMKRDKVLS